MLDSYCGADMADIFVSYAKEDLAAVDLLREDLEAKGFSVWSDTQLLPGHEWRTRLREEIDQSRALIVVWTSHSKNSTFVQEEVDRARSVDKPVIALRERGFKVEEVPLGFGSIQTHIISDRNAILKALDDFKIIPAAQIAQLSGGRSVYEIFARAIPDTTLVDRSNSPEGQKIRSALSKRGFCARLCGPTKSGKSVLLHQILGTRNPIYLSGGLIRNLQLFYGYLAVKVEGGQMLGDDEAATMERVLASKRPIVIDDFHRVNFPTRRAIVKRIQAFLDAEVNVVLVSWTDIEGEKIDSDPGLDGRSEPVEMSYWKAADITRIGRAGFVNGLNVEVDPQLLLALTHQSFQNPFLMQQYCCKVAELHGILERRSSPIKVSMTEDALRQMFKESCIQTRKHFLSCIERRGDQMVTLSTGATTSIYGLILLAVSNMEPIHKMGMDTLARKMRERVQGSTQALTPIAVESAVKAFMQRLEKNEHQHTAVDYYGGKLHIHPFFKRYLLWDFGPSKGYAHPDLTRYQDEPSDQPAFGVPSL